MNIWIYIGIFVFKIIEDALGTLRIIVVSNGKKILGAVLQFIIALIWVVVTGTVITNVHEDPWKILFFALGSLVGSYFGSALEEKIALGNIVLMVEVEKQIARPLIGRLKKAHFKVNGVIENKDDKVLLMVSAPRKKAEEVTKIIRAFDDKAFIFTEKVKVVSPRL